MFSSFQPFLIFTVTGLLVLFTTSSTICPINTKLSNSLLPSPFFTTFGAGHPILMSIMSAYFSTILVACPIIIGSLPNICIAIGLFSSFNTKNCSVFLSL